MVMVMVWYVTGMVPGTSTSQTIMNDNSEVFPKGRKKERQHQSA